jgi:hypothetical protein
MNKLFEKLVDEFRGYAQVKLSGEEIEYLKKCFEEAYLAGKIKGLKEGLKIKNETH